MMVPSFLYKYNFSKFKTNEAMIFLNNPFPVDHPVLKLGGQNAAKDLTRCICTFDPPFILNCVRFLSVVDYNLKSRKVKNSKLKKCLIYPTFPYKSNAFRANFLLSPLSLVSIIE